MCKFQGPLRFLRSGHCQQAAFDIHSFWPEADRGIGFVVDAIPHKNVAGAKA